MVRALQPGPVRLQPEVWLTFTTQHAVNRSCIKLASNYIFATIAGDTVRYDEYTSRAWVCSCSCTHNTYGFSATHNHVYKYKYAERTLVAKIEGLSPRADGCQSGLSAALKCPLLRRRPARSTSFTCRVSTYHDHVKVLIWKERTRSARGSAAQIVVCAQAYPSAR